MGGMVGHGIVDSVEGGNVRGIFRRMVSTDPLTGTVVNVSGSEGTISDDEFISRIYGPTLDGTGEFLVMVLRYTCVK